jgi:hypothetical protein
VHPMSSCMDMKCYIQKKKQQKNSYSLAWGFTNWLYLGNGDRAGRLLQGEDLTSPFACMLRLLLQGRGV